jgi:subtilisin family serine protease
VVVVAAAGNQHQGTEVDPTPYPAGYPGVLGVGAVDETGTRLPTSQVGAYVDLTAPGAGVLAAARGQGLASYDGTSFAVPFVAATAALVWQYHPTLSADQVISRILGTVDPAPGGAGPADGYGRGILNPYRAVTEQLTPAGVAVPPAAHLAPPDQARASDTASGSRTAAGLLALGAVLLAGLIALVASVLPHGAARRWQPGRG